MKPLSCTAYAYWSKFSSHNSFKFILVSETEISQFVKSFTPLFSARGRATNSGQVPGEVGRAEGALREGAARRILPRQVLGRPQHQPVRREQRLLRRHHHVSF